MLIDLLSPADLDSISDVYSHAFSPEEAPLMDKLTRDLLETQSTPETLCLGLRVDDRLIAVMGLSPIEFVSEAAISGYVLAPLAVHAEFQGRGYARQLIEGGIQQLSHQGVDIVCVYGDPDFYGKFGFDVSLGTRFSPPYALEFPLGWHARKISDIEVPLESLRFQCVSALSDPIYW